MYQTVLKISNFCIASGQVEILNHMLSRCTGLEIDARNSLGFTPLMKAALQGRTKCAKLLLFAGQYKKLSPLDQIKAVEKVMRE